MMKLILLNSNINDANTKYKGLYRYFDLDIVDSKIKTSIIIKNRSSGPVNYSKMNAKIMKNISDKLNNKCDLLLYDKKQIKDIPTGFQFIGYDICADSCFYSPLGDNYLEKYEKSLFYEKMSKEDYEYYTSLINKYGLFENYEVANRFSVYCTMINKLYPHVIEEEEKWEPYSIYLYNI